MDRRRRVATRVDLARSTGVVHALRRWRRDRRFARLVPGRRRQIARELWTDAAAELGAKVVQLEPNHFEIKLGAATTRVKGQTVALNDPAASDRAADKPHLYRLLSEAGVPVPEHYHFGLRDLAPTRDFLARGPLPCVVKPARGSGGDGVTGGVRTAGDLERGVLWASRYAPTLLIERQAPGDVLRALVLDDDVLDVVRRRPPTVTGDGRSTIEQLTFREYDRRIRADGDPGIKPFAVDLDCLLALHEQGLSLHSVPATGTTIRVKTVTNYNRPVDNDCVRSTTSETLCMEAIRAARAAGLRLAGVDIVAHTPCVDADGTGVVIDVNPVPALHHHLHVARPESTSNVAIPILRALLHADA